MSANLEKSILEYLETNPGSLARDIANFFEVDKKEVNHHLYSSLRNQVVQDKSYRWTIASRQANANNEQAPRTSPYPDTPLSKLARYYLACVSYDQLAISVFAYNKYGDPDYAELESLPADSSDLFAQPAMQQLIRKADGERSRKTVYLGYPVWMNHLVSRRSNWQGFMVQPFFLFPIERDPDTRTLEVNFSAPSINMEALKNITQSTGPQLMDELVQLERELGIGEEETLIELDELVLRLNAIRPEWSWVETPDNDIHQPSSPLTEVNSAGIFNRAIVIMGDKSKFTQGLESELQTLAKMPEQKYTGTALDMWVSGSMPEDPVCDEQPLIEVLPMNNEQRQAVQSALTQPLTIITGPPGTGKSQVVTNLLMNAAWQGKRILFASKNNKAVDVVDTRINNLAPRPILLRQGSRSYQTKLAEYLLAFLSSTASTADKEEFEEAKERHERLLHTLNEQDASLSRLVEARNTADTLEQNIETLRHELGTEDIKYIEKLDLDGLIAVCESFKLLVEAGDCQAQGFLTRIFWTWISKGRYQAISERLTDWNKIRAQLKLIEYTEDIDETSIQPLKELLGQTLEIICLCWPVQEYLTALRTLQSFDDLGDFTRKRQQTLNNIASNSSLLWKLWIRLQPSDLSRAERDTLNRYDALLRMVMDTGNDDQLDRDIYRQYSQLFPKVAHLLPCWAVTSLSARGKIPMESGYFDIVVFDEASQCDIASAIPLLFRAKQAVVIGDPKQLSHIPGLPRGQDQQLLKKFGLLNYVHWSYTNTSLYKLAAGLCGNIVSLVDHHRSHADIIRFSNEVFYEDRLRVATSYDNLKQIHTGDPGIRWIDVKGKTIRPPGGGAYNSEEVQGVIEELQSLVSRGYKGSIGVVTPFRAQVNAIEQAVSKSELAFPLQSLEFMVDTAHGFQGDERDVMIFSPVISSGIQEKTLSFLQNNGNLFNVAITRAKAQLIVIGDKTACGSCGMTYIEQFTKYLNELETNTLQPWNDFEVSSADFGPEYPTVRNPEQVSDWEILFYKALFQSGIKTIPQFRVEKYALDLALIIGDSRLDIEVDGERYHRNWTGEYCRRDQIRNQRMYELGWDVMRFWVYEIRDDLENCIKKVQNWIENQPN